MSATAIAMDPGPGRCRDCRRAVPSPRAFRCTACLLKRIERVKNWKTR